jgi:PKD repeat protein
VPRCSVLCLFTLVAACGGQGNDIQEPPSNVPPVAAFGTVCTDLTCTFSDSSSDANGTIVSHQWAFGDGGEADAPSPDHTYASAGVYVAQLVVADDRGATASAERQVTVTVPTPPAGVQAITFSDTAIGFCFSPGSTRICAFTEEHVLFSSLDGTALPWTAASDQPWIVFRPASGTTPTDVKVWVDLNKLPPRNNSRSVSGLIAVSSTRGTTTVQSIPVKLQYYSSPPPQ